MIRRTKHPSFRMKRRQVASPSLALVSIDSTPIRNKEVALYQERCSELNRESERLRVFEKEDSPAYRQWLEREFATSLAKIRDLHCIVKKLSDKVEQVRDYAHQHDISLKEAHRELKEVEEKGIQSQNRQNNSSTRAKFSDDDEQAFTDADMGREKKEDEDFNSELAALEAEQTASQKTTESYLKSIYRKLARILHPDINKDPKEQDRQLWNQAQQAYSVRDVQSLQEILNSLASYQGSILNLDAIPIGDIIDLRCDIESQLRSMRFRIEEAEAEPSWSFCSFSTSPSDLQSIKFATQEGLILQLEELWFKRSRLKKQIAGWQRPTVRRKSFPYQKYEECRQMSFF